MPVSFRSAPHGAALFVFLVAMLVFAPLIRGGNRPVPLLLMELAALAALAAIAWQWSAGARRSRLPATLALALAVLAAVPVVQLVPLPAAWWAALPGHEAYAAALRAVEVAPSPRPASIHASATRYAALALLPPIAVFLATLSLGRSQLRVAAAVFVGVAACEALLGILQLGAGRGSPLYLGNPHGAGFALGTYVNKNHLASMLAMALPIAVAFWAIRVLGGSSGEEAQLHPRHADRRLAGGIALSVLVLLVLVALFFTRSRAGIASGLLAFALATLALVWRDAPRGAKAAFVAVGLAALAFAAYVGLTPVLDAFAPDALALGYEGRLAIAQASLRAGLDFLPLGSGLGTFADVFPRYQDRWLGGFVQHAHNDYLEAFVEMGVAALAVIALFAAAYAAGWARHLRRGPGRRLATLQAAAGFGIAAMAVHAAFDFNLHIPANAVYFAFLAGLFLATPDEGRASGGAAPPR